MPENEEQVASEDESTEIVNETDHSNEIIDQKVKAMRKTNKPKVFGLFVVIFIAVILIMIGGLASYYYYTYQSQGNATEQDVQDSWNEVVITTVELTNSFNRVGDFADLTAENRGSFRETLGTTNRTLRDTLYELQSANSYVFSLPVIADITPPHKLGNKIYQPFFTMVRLEIPSHLIHK